VLSLRQSGTRFSSVRGSSREARKTAHKKIDKVPQRSPQAKQGFVMEIGATA
jgi:hypothetical protein